MPNTLAHIGFQSLISRSVLRDIDPKWILIGCVVPDVPWILQRVLTVVIPGVEGSALHYYADAQAALFGCLILCAALAVLAPGSFLVFGLLGFNSVLHLLLDAAQTKWGNGVNFLAPFEWNFTNWGLFWPESIFSYVLTAVGFACILLFWRSGLRTPGIRRPNWLRLSGFVSFAAAYLTVPLLFIQGPKSADFPCMTLTREERVGCYAEFDRAQCTPMEGFLDCFDSDGIRVTGVVLDRPSTVSLRGTFVSENEFQARESHIHLRSYRDGVSYFGLAMIAALWLAAWIRFVFFVPVKR